MRYLLASALLLSCLHAAAPPARDTARDADLELLSENKLGTDGPSLLAFLRRRYSDVTDAQIKALIEQLGDESFDSRQDASRSLMLLGIRARPFLRTALAHTDLEVRNRATLCLAEIDRGGALTVDLIAAVVRHIGRVRPEGATKALLACLDSAEDEAIAAEVASSLASVGVTGGKPDPLLVAALEDRSARRRLAAATALCRGGAKVSRPAVLKLLEDREGSVRIRTALALLEVGEREAVKALIAEMAQPQSREGGLAEDLLFRLAGERSPSLGGDDEASRKKYRTDWEAWWKDHGGKVDLTVLSEQVRVAGFTTVVLLDQNEIVDLDAANRVRWKITGLDMPLDVQRLPRDRVLVAEHNGNRVTERDSKGEVVWEHRINAPLMAQRLPNGNTFIAYKQGLVEVDPKGNSVWTYSRPGGDIIMRARKLPGGDVIMITQLGVARFVRIDRFGKDVCSFGVEVYTSGGRIDLTPAGNVLIPELHNMRVVERKMDGTIAREIKVEQPITALALPGGNIIITSMTQKRAYEIDRSGKEVWELKRDTRVTRAVRH